MNRFYILEGDHVEIEGNSYKIITKGYQGPDNYLIYLANKDNCKEDTIYVLGFPFDESHADSNENCIYKVNKEKGIVVTSFVNLYSHEA